MTFPSFVPNEILTSSDMNAVGWWRITSFSPSSNQGAFTINNAFSADYDVYRLVYTGGVGVGLGNMSVTLGASATGYNWSLPYVIYGSGTPAGTSVGSAASFPLCGTHTTAYAQFDMNFIDPFAARFTRVWGQYASTTEAGMYSGIHQVAASYTSVTVTPNVANINGGVFTLYGLRK